MDRKTHWEQVYAATSPERLGWYEPHLEISLSLIREARIGKDESIIDVGGGASTLVDDLLAMGFEDITVLDLSANALRAARARLGDEAGRVAWIEADVTSIALPRHYGLWHDRAVFHFLTGENERRDYAARLHESVKPGGRIVIGTFALEAPPRCSGLPVERYTPDRLRQVLGGDLRLRAHLTKVHRTPGGVEQMYLYCHFEKTASTPGKRDMRRPKEPA